MSLGACAAQVSIAKGLNFCPRALRATHSGPRKSVRRVPIMRRLYTLSRLAAAGEIEAASGNPSEDMRRENLHKIDNTYLAGLNVSFEVQDDSQGKAAADGGAPRPPTGLAWAPGNQRAAN